MAFKMKGSAFKLNEVATKSTMKLAKKAMKMKQEESAMKLKTSYKMKEAMAKMKDKSAMKDKLNDFDHQTSQRHDKDGKHVKGDFETSPVKQAKPDYPDIDGDGNTKESMKQAAADKKSPIKDTKYFGQNTSHDEVKAVTNHNKRHRDGWPADHKRKKEADKSPAKHRVTKEQFPNNYNAHNSAHDKGEFKSATDHSPAKHRVGKKAHDSAHDGTHPTADKFINDKHETKEGLARKEKMAKKDKA